MILFLFVTPWLGASPKLEDLKSIKLERLPSSAVSKQVIARWGLYIENNNTPPTPACLWKRRNKRYYSVIENLACNEEVQAYTKTSEICLIRLNHNKNGVLKSGIEIRFIQKAAELEYIFLAETIKQIIDDVLLTLGIHPITLSFFQAQAFLLQLFIDKFHQESKMNPIPTLNYQGIADHITVSSPFIIPTFSKPSKFPQN